MMQLMVRYEFASNWRSTETEVSLGDNSHLVNYMLEISE